MAAKKDDSKWVWLPYVVYPSVVVVWWFATELIYHATGDDWARAAERSDSFGAVNALFAALAFAGVIHAVILQTHELREQRRELQLQRVVNKESAAAQQASERALREQVNCQFFGAYLSALHELSQTPPLTQQNYAQRRAYDTLTQLLNRLDEQAETILGSTLKITPYAQHVSDVLHQFADQLAKLKTVHTASESQRRFLVQDLATKIDLHISQIVDPSKYPGAAASFIYMTLIDTLHIVKSPEADSSDIDDLVDTLRQLAALYKRAS